MRHLRNKKYRSDFNFIQKSETRGHTSGNGRDVCNSAIIEANISYFRPEIIEVCDALWN